MTPPAEDLQEPTPAVAVDRPIVEHAPIFLFGSPRSGTTFLQRLLGAHPQIATPQETTLFTRYIGPMLEAWDQQLPLPEELAGNSRRFVGLPSVLTEEQFHSLLRQVAHDVYHVVLDLKPGASRVLDKMPEYSTEAARMHGLFPDATYVHIIRDGRDVTCSLLRASRGWGARWAPKTVDEAATRWRSFVESGRQVQRLTDRYVELRYEDLLGLSPSGASALQQVFSVCGLEVTRAEAQELLEDQRLDNEHKRATLVWGGEVKRRLGRDPEEPAGFFGKGRAGTWEDEMNAYQRWQFAEVAGDLLDELGYAKGSDWLGETHSLRLAPLRHGLERGVIRARRVAGEARRAFTA